MHKQLNIGLNLGLVGNALFIGFASVCAVYYLIYDPESTLTRVVEIIAYALEFGGFLTLIAADVLIARTTRMRKWMKIGFTFYIIMEAFMMFCELDPFRVESFYDPYSFALAIVHSIISAAVCLSFLSLDPYKAKFETVVIVCVGMMLGGMFGNLMGIRIYFSIFVNAVAFTVLFGAIKFLQKREEIEIDCHGDKAKVTEYSQKDFFE